MFTGARVLPVIDGRISCLSAPDPAPEYRNTCMGIHSILLCIQVDQHPGKQNEEVEKWYDVITDQSMTNPMNSKYP